MKVGRKSRETSELWNNRLPIVFLSFISTADGKKNGKKKPRLQLFYSVCVNECGLRIEIHEVDASISELSS